MRAKPYRLSLSHPWPDYRGRHIVVVTGDRNGCDEAMVDNAMSAEARTQESPESARPRGFPPPASAAAGALLDEERDHDSGSGVPGRQR